MKYERPLVKDMKTQDAGAISLRSFLVAAALVGMLLLSFAMQSFGQKEQAERATTRDGLTVAGFLTNPEVSDDLEGTEDEYFYKFQTRPGKLTLTLEVTANETNAGAMLDLFGANSKAILSNILVQAADGGSERVSKSVNLAKGQDIVIRIKGLRYGSSAGYPGVYKIVLGGTAVNFGLGKPASQPDVANEGTSTPPVGTGGKIQNENPAETPANGQVGNVGPIGPETGGNNQNKTPDSPQSEGTGSGTLPVGTPADGTGPTKERDAVDKAIEKGKSKTKKVLDILNKIKTNIPS